MLKSIKYWLSIKLNLCAWCFASAEGGMNCRDIKTEQPYIICVKCAEDTEEVT